MEVFSQVKSIIDQVEYSSGNDGKIRIVQEDAVKDIVDRHQMANSKQDGLVGYRVRIFSDSGPGAKAAYDNTLAAFFRTQEKVEVYETFDYPFYKIYVGDFRTRSEALYLLKQIEEHFPDAFIVRTKINYPNL